MFRCQSCQKKQPPKVASRMVVVEKRTRKYTSGGIGWEIVKEIRCCPDCVTKLSQLS